MHKNYLLRTQTKMLIPIQFLQMNFCFRFKPVAFTGLMLWLSGFKESSSESSGIAYNCHTCEHSHYRSTSQSCPNQGGWEPLPLLEQRCCWGIYRAPGVLEARHLVKALRMNANGKSTRWGMGFTHFLFSQPQKETGIHPVSWICGGQNLAMRSLEVQLQYNCTLSST